MPGQTDILHPIPMVAEAMRCLVEGKKEPLGLAPGSIKRLKEKLQTFFGKPELHANVAELCMFAVWVGSNKKSPKVREALLDVAETAIAELETLGIGGDEQLRDVITAARRDYSLLTGAATPRLPMGTHPKVGASALAVRGSLARGRRTPPSKKPRR